MVPRVAVLADREPAFANGAHRLIHRAGLSACAKVGILRVRGMLHVMRTR
ncbi:MAG: hypothetical protein AAF657_08935 [Acidobacteriota bacterium]